MKKLISMILTLAMIFSLSITALAEGETKTSLPESTTINVGAAYRSEDAEAPATVYYVKIEWTSNNTLTYIDKGVAYVWDAENLQYNEADAGVQAADKWEGEAAYTITATNHSNAVVNANVAVNAVDGFSIASEFTDSKSEMQLENAAKDVKIAEGEKGSAKKDSVSVSVEVTEGSIAEAGNVATITVTLSAANVAGE